jgi:hypothetical protein
MRTRIVLLTCVGLQLVGCTEEAADARDEVRLYHTATPTCVASLGADDRERAAEVTVLFDACISYCTDFVESSCAIERQGNTLHIEAFARTRLEWMPERVCPTACRTLQATCRSGPLPAGDYTVVQDQFSRTIALPSEIGAGDACCFDHVCANDE